MAIIKPRLGLFTRQIKVRYELGNNVIIDRARETVMEDKLYKLTVEGNKIVLVEASMAIDTDDDEEEEEIEVMMDKKLYKAAVEGDKTIFFTNNNANSDDEYLLRKNPQNNHMIHIAVRHERMEFIQEAVKRFPQLICKANSDGDNPLHLAAQTGNLDIMKVLVDSYKDYEQQQLIGRAMGKPKQAWRSKNKDGNTPLHVALIHGKIRVARFLVEEDGVRLARIRNKFNQRPLHLAIQYHVDGNREVLREVMKSLAMSLGTQFEAFTRRCCYVEKDSISLIKLLLQKDRLVACWRDKEGLTPLLRAAMFNPPYLSAIEAIVEQCPESVEVCDSSGKNLLHLMNDPAIYRCYLKMLNSSPEGEMLKNNRDDAGNTSAHIAVQNHNLDMLYVLIESGVDLTIRNEKGVSAADLIRQLGADEIRSLCTNAKYIDWEQDVSQDVYEAMATVNTPFLRDKNSPGNILHKICWEQYQNFNEGQLELIQQILDTMPSLISQPDIYGETAFHHIVYRAPEVVNTTFLDMLRRNFEKVQKKASDIHHLFYEPPWKAKNRAGNTLLHCAAYKRGPRHLKWAREMLEFDPDLAVEVNNLGETPLHVLSQPLWDPQVLEDMMDELELIVGKSKHATRIKDEKGDIPLISAAKRHCLWFVYLLIKMDRSLKYETDGDDNTFLHYLADMPVDQCDGSQILLNELEPEAWTNLNSANKEGNTPLHLAIKNDNFEMAKIFTESWMKIPLLDLSSDGMLYESVNVLLSIRNEEGKTSFHLIAGRSEEPSAEEFIQLVLKNSYELEGIVGICNNDGNTPLHLAIIQQDFKLVKMILESAIMKGQHDTILEIPNTKGQTPSGLIGSAQHLPKEFEDFLKSESKVVQAMLGVRSLSGVSTVIIKEYTNMIGVTAALLATITFTAAFTVPGGLNINNGTPLLMTKPAFQVFMVSDILAMCLSMMVLFCLLWIMTIGNKRHQMMLLDLTIFLLEAAFYATLSTFMMGLYVTVFPITQWIAILACALCSLLILLMHKRFIMKLIPCFIWIYVCFRKAYDFVRKSCTLTQHHDPTNHQSNANGNGNSGQADQQEATIVEMFSNVAN